MPERIDKEVSAARTLCAFVLYAGLAAVLGGCVTPRASQTASGGSAAGNGVIDGISAERELAETRRLLDAGDHVRAIPRLLLTISKYPNSEAAIEARYWLATAYLKVAAYRDAMDLFNEYLRLAPGGRYAEASQQNLAQLTEEYQRKYPDPDDLDARIAGLMEELRAEPDALEKQWTLADLLWKRGNYPEAGRIYLHIVDQHPEFAADATVASRIERLPDGQYVVLTPAEFQRREVARRPLEIINDRAFRSGRDLFTRETRSYVVTGQAVNRGDSILYGVEVTVTVYGVGNLVYDTQTVTFGRLNPGEVRAFSVRFRNFDNVENIVRHECVGTFGQ